MAIRIRRGNKIDFDKNKLVAGELGLVLDAGEVYFCYSPGNTKKLQTAEDLQNLLNASPEAYIALQQLIADLTADPNELANILNNISALQSGKFDKGNIVQNDTINDTTKVPSSAVTYAHGLEIDDLSQSVTTINNNLADKLPASSKKFRLETAGWYRVASYSATTLVVAKGSNCNSVSIDLKRMYQTNVNEYHNLLLMSVYNSSSFVKIGSLIASQIITKIRHTVDTANNTAYIEVYYAGETGNTVALTLSNTIDGNEYIRWVVIDPAPTEESASGTEVMSDLDLSAV